MKKRLLTMAMAALLAGSSFAYEVGSYVYTPTAKLKVEGANQVENGDFSNLFAGWTNETGGEITSWTVAPGEGPTGAEAAIKAQSQSNEAGTTLTNVWQLTQGVYTISYQAFFPSKQTTSITAGSGNYVNFFANVDGSMTISRAIADIVTFEEQSWTEVIDTIFVNTDQEFLVFQASNVPAGTMFTNFAINKVSQVYDSRILDRKMAFAEKLMAEPSLNVADAAAAIESLSGLIAIYREDAATGNLEDQEGGEAAEAEIDNALVEFLSVTTQDISSNFANIAITNFGKYNRGNISNGQVLKGFRFRGNNWWHSDGVDYFNKYILKGNDNDAGSVALYHDKLPAGKYFISAEIDNGTAGRGSNDWSTIYDLKSSARAFVGTDSAEAVVVEGPYFTRVYKIGELKEGETFEAGVWWASADRSVIGATPVCHVKNFQIRSFGNVADVVAHREAWDAFKAQYDAASNNRKKILELQADKANYPWKQDSLANALTQWDPYYNAVASWVDANGEDAGVASTEQLNDWAKYQGVEAYTTTVNEETGEETTTRNEYSVVRGYQYAVNYVTTENKPINDLAAAIKTAETTRDDDMNVSGDKATFQAAIDVAQGVLDGIKANTTDATQQADVATLTAAQETLLAAQETFLASAVMEPIVDIDFSNAIEAVIEDEAVTGYVVKGAKGQMEFGGNDVNLQSNTDARLWALGYNDQLTDVLRVGKNAAKVKLTELPTDEDVIRVQFDFWGGYLVNRVLLDVQLQNAAGEKVAGFDFGIAAWAPSYNDFNDAAKTGMDLGKMSTIGSSSQSNAAIYADNNKSSFDLIIDYKAQTVQGTIVNGKNGTSAGAPVAMPTVSDNKITTFVLSSSYDNADRRSWFDNLKVYKYPSSATSGISEISANKTTDNAIYTLGGVKVSKASKPGLYIQNGKKILVK